MKKSKKIKRLYILKAKLGTITDQELANKFSISRETVRKLRIKLKIKSYKKTHYNNNYDKIVKYLKKYGNKNIFILRKLKNDLKIDIYYKNKVLRLKDIKNIAKKEKIKLKFREFSSKYKHGVYGYLYKKCKCEICNLANNIRIKFRKIIKVNDCSYYANEYIGLYNLDKYKYIGEKLFYKFISEDFKLRQIKYQR